MIGIFGGTFDPVHYGHLRSALEVSEIAGLSEIRFIPCQRPPHRGTPGATPRQRLEMLQSALENAPPSFRIDPREMERPGPSFMVDTLRSLRHDIGLRPMALILGADAFRGLEGWHQWPELFDLAHILIMQRPGESSDWPQALAAIFKEREAPGIPSLHERHQGLIASIKVTPLAISASQIRCLLRAGKSVRFLTPDSVIERIETWRLYGSLENQKPPEA